MLERYELYHRLIQDSLLQVQEVPSFLRTKKRFKVRDWEAENGIWVEIAID